MAFSKEIIAMSMITITNIKTLTSENVRRIDRVIADMEESVGANIVLSEIFTPLIDIFKVFRTRFTSHAEKAEKLLQYTEHENFPMLVAMEIERVLQTENDFKKLLEKLDELEEIIMGKDSEDGKENS